MEAVIGLLLAALTYTWWIIVPIILFLVIQTYRRRVWIQHQRYVLLKVSVPKENEKAPVAAEQMFAALHGLHRDSRARFFEGSVQEHIGFEIVSQKGRINFYVYAPAAQKSFVEGQIYAQYPKAEIVKTKDYVQPEDLKGKRVAGTELKLTRRDVYPIKTFENFEDVDPLSGITAVLSDLGEDEEVWVQVLARPADDRWHKRGEAELKRLSGEGGGGAGSAFGVVGRFVGDLFSAATTAPETTSGGKPAQKQQQEPQPVDEAISSGIREKSAKLGYETKVRIVAASRDQSLVRNRLNAAIGAFKQYNTTNLNGFAAGRLQTKPEKVIEPYKARLFASKGYVLNIEELASIFHLPSVSVETPTISWAASSQGEPPEDLPIESSTEGLTIFAETKFRDKVQRFGIKPDDRRRHIYAIGKTGMGKTNMLENMVLADMSAGRGLAVVDPHGDFIESVLDHIPPERVNDVIVFNPADRDYPIAFNILEKVERDAKPLVASGVVGVFEKIYGHSWGPRLEHILRNTILALLDYPDSTLLDVPKLLANEKFRQEVISHIEDPVVKNFWTDEFGNYTERQRVEAIAPIQNKVGQFLSSTTIRNIVGQKHTAINVREVMDSSKILLLKLSKGELGEDASALLGAMLITKIQLAAMSRADIPEAQRRDFYLYVDEFQNFATESFATILSEARKYRLNLAMANQYVAQMPEEVRDAVFGNVGTIISFRVGASDADWLVKEFEPVFAETDIVNLDKYNIYLKVAIEGVTGNAFSARTIPLPDETTPYRDQTIHQTRERYAQGRDVVEAHIVGDSPEAKETEDADRKRRYQSYLDKERTFSEQEKTRQPVAKQQTGKPQTTPQAAEKSRPAPVTQTATEPKQSAKPAVKKHAAKKPAEPTLRQPVHRKPATAATQKPVAPKEDLHARQVPQKPQQAPQKSAQEAAQGELDEDTVIKF
ncbi:MAG: type IV secretion system DNA-binding domain-containing protein [bacterium]|nr:type IV secretion system DNA-binding domain-containing protein [bacterium]